MTDDRAAGASRATSAGVAAVDDEPVTHRERLAEVLEDRLDIPMAVLAVVWAALVTYELLVADPSPTVVTVSTAVWVVFVVEFVVKLAVSGHPLRFLRRRWPSVFFLALPALRILRVASAARAFRALPAARVVGSSYRAIGTARSLFGSRIMFLASTSFVVVFSGGQLLYLTEGEPSGRDGTFADALWWTANAAISGNQVFEPATTLGRLIAFVLSVYAIVVFASLAAVIGAFFIESGEEKKAAESPSDDAEPPQEA